MNKKAISPLIATVLIIGFTIVLAAVILQWAGGFVKNLTAEQEKTVNLQTACMGMDLEVKSAIFDGTTLTVNFVNNVADKNLAGALLLGETAKERINLKDDSTEVKALSSGSLSVTLPLSDGKTVAVNDKVLVVPKVSVSGETKACDVAVAATATITAA